MKNLYYGGYGKYQYYTVAETEQEANKNLTQKPGLKALPISCKKIDMIDGHLILPVTEDELEGKEEQGEVKEDKEEVKVIDNLSHRELIQLAKELNIEGKIATFKTAELKQKIKAAQSR